MQIPILDGIYTDEAPDFRTSYPRNMVPVPKNQGISNGYLRPSEGIVELGEGPGIDRGGINWNGTYFRVMGTELISIDKNGNYASIGDVGGTSQVSFTYSFDYLAIASNNNLFLYNGTTLTQVTDTDLGVVLDVEWVDGYFMTTDGEFLVVTDLDNPFAVNPLKYGSSEANPDPIKGILKLRNEIYAMNRYTIEVFDNVGSAGFPFQRVESAQIERGVLGTHSACVFMEALAFLGSGFNEAPAIWVGGNSSSTKISTREIDQILSGYTEAQLSSVVLEERTHDGHMHLYIHLPNETLVFDGAASRTMNIPVWFTLGSSLVGNSIYKAKNFVWCYDKWLCGDPTSTKHGYFDSSISTHYGEIIGWEFGTSIVYNNGNGAIFHDLELVALTGRVEFGSNPTIWSQYSTDGITWSQEKSIQAGRIGERNKRLLWLQQGHMNHIRMQRFRGTSDAHISIARLEATLEALNV